MTTDIYPLHKKPALYRLDCMYAWGGENEIPLLLHTNVNLKKLAKDMPNFLDFVSIYLATHFSFANYMTDGNEGIFSVEGIERGKDEDTHDFLDRVTQELSKDNPNVFSGAFDITVSEYYPSSFMSFEKVSSKDEGGALWLCPSKYVLSVFIKEQVQAKAA